VRAGQAEASRSAPPLVVDIDGTLLVTDLLHESLLQFLARYPFEGFRPFGWLLGGKDVLRTRLADRVEPGIDAMPLRDEVVRVIRAAQAEGRNVFLASASDRRHVQLLADRLGGIAGVFATEAGHPNLVGEAKARRLVAEFGERGYDYVGNHQVDFEIWRSARGVVAVAHTEDFARKVRAVFPHAEIITQVKTSFAPYLRALRLHQWVKNSLVFLPMVAGHRFETTTIAASLIAFFAFCFAASSAYVINDLLDLPADRDHPRKSRRPFACGQVPISHGVVLSAALMGVSVALAVALPPGFATILALYVFSTLSYSLFLKRKLLIDVVMLGALYTLRVYGGLAANALEQTQWLLAFCLFLFLSLAIVKRCSELEVKRSAGLPTLTGRGYRVEDLAVLLPLGAAAGYGAVFVVTLYLSSPEVMTLYAHPTRLWLMLPLLLYWLSRVLVLANRGDLHDDPLVFALTDRNSWGVAAGVAAIIVAAM
jgi:4-hydroxybenzoate polyprenyltransferase